MSNNQEQEEGEAVSLIVNDDEPISSNTPPTSSCWEAKEERTCRGRTMHNMIHRYSFLLTALILVGATLVYLAIRSKHDDEQQQQQYDPPPEAPNFSSIQQPAFVYIFKSHGMGSALLNMFATAAYMNATQPQRTLVVVETFYAYKPEHRAESTAGVLTGWFTPQFPVIDTLAQFDEFILPLITNHEGKDLVDGTFPVINNKGPKKCTDWASDPLHSPVATFACMRDDSQHLSLDYFDANTDEEGATPDALYQPMVDIMCRHMQFNPQTVNEVEAFRQVHGNIPSFSDTTTTTTTTTVAFHVRRGDKLLHESRLYTGQEYVAKLVQVVPPNTMIHHCFVATDDYVAINEIRVALQNAEINCQVHSFTQKDEKSRSDTLEFIVELSFLIHATYFVGSFNSNVGAMVAILRACHHPGGNNYSNSFDVEGSRWYLPQGKVLH